MKARDLMSRDVVTVQPDTPLREVARILLQHQMSAVPVTTAAGDLVGMVSEGDLVGRKKTERETRSEWWLMRLAEGETLNTEFLAHLQSPLAVAREVMSSPVIAISEDTSADEIASLMGIHRIKRLPVLRDGRLVGIVRRADLLRSLGGGQYEPVALPPTPQPGRAHVETSAVSFHHEQQPQPDDIERRGDGELSVNDFRHLVARHVDRLISDRRRQREIADEQRRHNLRLMIDTHISEKGWNGVVHAAREAAERGETEFLLLRFPSTLCSDGGRAVNAPDPEWPRTLRGAAAEMYLRWERELRPRGFHILARVLDFLDGLPGDIGLFLSWGT